MADIKVPELGESIVEAAILSWRKNEGDPVAKGETVVELETDKVNVEVASEEDGVLEAILKPAGETVSVGETIARIRSGAAGQAAQQVPNQPARGQEPTPPETKHSNAGEKGLAVESRPVEASQGKTGPQTADNPLPAALDQATAPSSVTPPTPRTPSQRRKARQADGPQATPATSAARTEVVREATAPTAPVAPGTTTASPLRPDEDRIPMTRRRQTIARRLLEAKQSTAMLTTFNEIDMSAVLDLRRRRKDQFKEEHGVGLGFMSFFTKAAVGALKAFPMLNAEIEGNEIVVKHHYDIGIAVATPAGLVVPVVRDADRLTFAEIESRITDLAKRAREGTLHPQELQGGTFTITNGGVFGSLFSTPILNPPQVGILGMHAIKERPVAVEGQIVLRPMMYVALSYDHRIVDGAEAVQFLVKVKEMVEDPETLLLEG
ncbi:2-oxoglutarate dehydrogenase complex dihydrolipoyllysine-residue succinyltransferase [Kyrpidia spormannii]|uniref:2-oxoglutarate dehydrogenase complex (Dihydrolipoamide transsuccinylase, E2 subunit) n=1 Tax=Kyrpidia spormannii TaxID=2055160 RepID=A0ACA8ZA84_9BACL|nr:2-oxoglutarate dehydrogenase complex dihydrolipoyllysine-residue succinyltransferase [Kyrpidia spormannii]CAB3392744.1 2-oxoglutarate dehydrogenase complex (dihydrolipoamide transsuccinylase, E2 subunit) [Kyrpidia spormannii]